MKFFEKLPFASKRKPVLTSRPVFQFSSSFLDSDYDDNDLKKQAAHDFNQSRQLDVDVCDLRLKPRSRAHLIVHSINTILSIISLSLFIATIPIWNANFQHIRSVVSGDYTDGLVLAPLFLGLFGSLSVLVIEFLPSIPFFTKFTTKSRLNRKRSLQNLLAFTVVMTLPPTLILSATNSLALLWEPTTKSHAGPGKSLFECNLSNILTQPCQPLLYTIGGLQIGGIVTGALVWFLWVVLFVLGIRECVRARKEKKERRQKRREERELRRQREGRSYGHRHGRRKGHERSHRGARGLKSQDGTIDSDRAGSPRTDGVQHPRAVLSRAGSGASSRKTEISHGPNPFVVTGTQQIESPAAQLASHKVRPKQKMQVWLADRNA